MSEPFVGEIMMFAGNFAPKGWAFCDGQSVSVSQYTTLFDLIGTVYGGDGQTTFNLPNAQSRVPVHMGTAASSTTYTLGETGGVEEVTLTVEQMAAHSHMPMASVGSTHQEVTPIGTVWANDPQNAVSIYYLGTVNSPVQMANVIDPSGDGQPHDNIQRYLAINFCISLDGIYPSKN